MLEHIHLLNVNNSRTYTSLMMGLFGKLFGQANGSGENSPTLSKGTNTTEHYAPNVAVVGLHGLPLFDLSDDNLEYDIVLPMPIYGHFDRVSLEPWSNSLTIYSSKIAPPSQSEISAVFDDLFRCFGIDGHGDGKYDAKDIFQWDKFRNVGRGFYFYSNNFDRVMFSKNNPWAEGDILNKPSISVSINRDVEDPERDCRMCITHWPQIKERYKL